MNTLKVISIVAACITIYSIGIGTSVRLINRLEWAKPNTDADTSAMWIMSIFLWYMVIPVLICIHLIRKVSGVDKKL